MWIPTMSERGKTAYPKIILYSIVSLFLLFYLISKAVNGGNDINVYLHAARQLFYNSNIYTLNPFNSYLYSPLFAVLLSPLAFVNTALAQVIWLFLNIIMIIRLWNIQKELVNGAFLLTKYYKIAWAFGIAILSFGFLNHNFNLGQVTILILWLTIEGLYQVRKDKNIKGAAFLALGINIKIIPMLALVYLFFKIKFRAITYAVLLVGFSLLIPALFIGFEYNNKLLITWKSIINPSGEKYVFENNDGCNSLNALLPAYLYDFKELSNIEKEPNWHLKRQIMNVSESVLIIILQTSRILLILLIPLIIFYRRKERQSKQEYLYFFWEIAYLMLVTLLVFPHQMKYSMLYFVPVGAYVLFYYLLVIQERLKINTFEKIVGYFSALCMLVLAIMGRDIIGNYMVNILDYYHFMGINNLLFLIILGVCNPYRLVQRYEEKQSLIV
jgi:hypothetical protein